MVTADPLTLRRFVCGMGAITPSGVMRVNTLRCHCWCFFSTLPLAPLGRRSQTWKRQAKKSRLGGRLWWGGGYLDGGGDELTLRPAMKAVTRPTKVVPPITEATTG